MSRKTKKGTDLTVQKSITKVLFFDKQLLMKQEQNQLDIVSVELPRKTSMFIRSGNSIYELLQFNEKHRSWFLESTVCSNGKIYMTTKIDPLFIFLQFIEEHCKIKAQPVNQILEGSAGMFIDVLKHQQMKMVADQKGPDDLKAFMFNEEKTMKWLKKKILSVQNSLRKQNIISSGSSSMNFVKSSVDFESVDEDVIAEAALGIISEYISLDLLEKLDEVLGISKKSIDAVKKKRKSEGVALDGDSKKIKIEEQENLIDFASTNKKEVKVTTKTKALEKAAKGSKAISSFFNKK